MIIADATVAYPNEPTKETIDAWEQITMTPALNLTADELSQLGLSTDSVQWPESAGGVRPLPSSKPLKIA